PRFSLLSYSLPTRRSSDLFINNIESLAHAARFITSLAENLHSRLGQGTFVGYSDFNHGSALRFSQSHIRDERLLGKCECGGDLPVFVDVFKRDATMVHHHLGPINQL